MELRQLRYLLAVAAHGGFSRAAVHEHVAQSALSEQVARLERELGTPLLVRDRRGVRPTPAGEQALVAARRVLAEVDALAGEVAAAAGRVRGVVRLGILPPLGPIDLPALLEAFAARHPEVELRLREGPVDESYALLRADGLDAAFVAVDVAHLPAPLAGLPAGEDVLVAACAPGHPLAALPEIHLGLLAGEALVSFPEGSALRAIATRALDAAGVTPRIAFESNHIGTLRALVARGLGVALMPSTLAAHPGPQVTARPLAGEPVRLQVTLAWRAARRLPPAVEAFVALTRETLTAMLGP